MPAPGGRRQGGGGLVYLSGQKCSPPGLSRTCQRRPHSPPRRDPWGVPTKKPDGVDGAALPSPLTCGETLPEGESGPSDRVAGAPTLGSPEPNPTAQPEAGGHARLAADPRPRQARGGSVL